jgi:hypothetical protein
VQTQDSSKAKSFVKVAHLFAHRKQGAQKRFEKEYLDLAEKVKSAWLADLLKIEEEMKHTGQYNQALAKTKTTRIKEQAEKTARETLATVFKEWRAEISRIVSDLGGYPQEDGNVLFPDGSIARMPKGLWIPQDQIVRFN